MRNLEIRGISFVEGKIREVKKGRTTNVSRAALRSRINEGEETLVIPVITERAVEMDR